MSNLFQTVKAAVTARQAAERYGLHVTPTGLALCPFHHDKTPSMKVDSRYYCFACGETGDAIDLTARLLNLSPKDAALRLAADFNINVPDECPGHFSVRENNHPPPKSDPERELRLWRDFAVDNLVRYRWLLRDWELRYARQGLNDGWNTLFCLALRDRARVEYLLDELLSCSADRLEDFKISCGEEVRRYAGRVGKFTRSRQKRDDTDPQAAAPERQETDRSEH